MKKVIILGTVLMLSMLAFAPAAQAWWIFPSYEDVTNWFDNLFNELIGANEVGYSSQVETFVENGDNDYYLIQQRTVKGHRQALKETVIPKTCYPNATCFPAYSIYEVDPTKLGLPIYTYETIGLEVNGKTITFDNKGCYICGNKLTCFDKKDGWSKNRNPKWRCTCRSGESCVEYDLDSEKITYAKSDHGGMGLEKL